MKKSNSKDNWLHLKYALIYAPIIYILASIIFTVFSAISAKFFQKNEIINIILFALAQIIILIIYVKLSYQALDKVTKKTKYFEENVVWWILLFYILIINIVSFVDLLIKNGSLSLQLVLDAFLGKSFGLGLLLVPGFIANRYRTKHKVRERIPSIKPILFFKTSFGVFILSMVLIMISTFFIFSQNNFFPIFKNRSPGFVGLEGLILAISVVAAIIVSYLISCFVFYVYEKLKRLKNK